MEPPADRSEDLSNYDTVSVRTMNANCVACHTNYDEPGNEGDPITMHASAGTVSCVDCHGGNWQVAVPAGISPSDPSFERLKNQAHVLPNPKTAALWMTGARLSSANPEIPGALTLSESPDYIRFVNPGDLHAAKVACYNCHASITANTERSMMAHGAMLWGAALYNNGAINRKNPVFGESYTVHGTPRALLYNRDPAANQKTRMPGPPSADDTRRRGILPFLYPLSRWEVSQPGNVLRVFERGSRLIKGIEVANPNILLEVDPGKPDVRLSVRGFGTAVRTDPVFLGLQKTRLLDPTLNLFGTNDHPGDFRASGCSACHVVYANDRSPVHSGRWAAHGNMGFSATKDPSIPRNESGHPISHQFVRSPPTQTCIVCHIHPGTLVMNSYLGFTWWDNETDAELMYPKTQKYPTGDDEFAVNQHNPEQAATRGLWSNRFPNDQNHLGMVAGENFLERIYTDINPQLKHTQFADFHGHGWVFRAVFKQDRHGNLLDHFGKKVENPTAEKMKAGIDFQATKDQPTPPAGIPVHLKDIHLEMGMHCVDCHFLNDVHGNGNLYGEARNATAIECVDCHGTQREEAVVLQYLKASGPKRTELLRRVFSGNAASSLPDETIQRMISGRFQLQRQTGRLLQKRSVDKDGEPWVVSQTKDDRVKRATWNDSSEDAVRARRALYAHTVRVNGKWGVAPTPEEVAKDPSEKLAHDPDHFSCYACHTSWNTSCFGCHLPMRANWRKPMLHNEAIFTRNYTNYNFQTLRDDVYMLGIDGTVKGSKVVPIRSA
ncbi:MAG: cytochrome c family protein, partial [Phycisphaerae bacterium]|nr:cytochrome c family protein [Phycisphaerae bacterium]